VSHKSPKIAALLSSLPDDGAFDRHYLGFFQCFNQQLFFEAHEVLEELWLPERGGPRDLFYKGLIQLAGAFVHVQKGRRQPALALLHLARQNLGRFPNVYENLDISRLLILIDHWASELDGQTGPLARRKEEPWPHLSLGADEPPQRQ
jgi:Domain of unknown function (DUF309)